MRKTIIAGNWKMNLTAVEAKNLARSIADYVGKRSDPLVILCPPSPLLSIVGNEIAASNVELSAQNVHSDDLGAFTGESSDTMLHSVGCAYTLIGHSERRAIFNEDDDFINKKVKRVVAGPLKPILCIGETLEEREQGKTNDRIKQQLRDDLKNVRISSGEDLIIAYEPVWAIGTGKTATPDQAEEVHAYIRQLLEEIFTENTANAMSILYGGSVKPENAVEILAQPNIDGALVGGASLTTDSFTGILNSV